jgi:hypothetical protein
MSYEAKIERRPSDWKLEKQREIDRQISDNMRHSINSERSSEDDKSSSSSVEVRPKN